MVKLPRLPLKKTEKLAEKQAYGETLGKLKAEYHFKHTKKGWIKSLRDHIGKIIDNIDVVELAAVLGLSYLIKRIIVEKFEDVIATFGIPFWLKTPWLVEVLGMKSLEPMLKKKLDEPQIEILEWILSFTIAYIVVKHGGALFTMLGEGAKSLTGIVGLFFKA